MKKLIALFLLFPLCAHAWNLPTNCSVSGQALQFDNTNGWACVTLPIPPQKSDLYTATNGFNYTIPNNVTIEVISSATLIVTGALTLPSAPTDGMPLTLEAPKGVTTVSLVANTGQTISGVPVTAFAANTPYRLKYSGINSTWYPN